MPAGKTWMKLGKEFLKFKGRTGLNEVGTTVLGTSAWTRKQPAPTLNNGGSPVLIELTYSRKTVETRNECLRS
jgi:hypothetical protein